MVLPPKSTFRFQELPAITGIKPYVLRFWETEFEEIAPIADESGEKHYSRADVEIVLQIKALLFDHKMSITEAKSALRNPELKAANIAALAESDVLSPILDALKIIQDVKQKHHW